LTDQDYFDPSGAAIIVHNGTLLASIEQDLGCQAMARGRAKNHAKNRVKTGV
jgi:hypothetical protein